MIKISKLGVFRTIGQEWLVTIDDAETYIPEVGEVGSIVRLISSVPSNHPPNNMVVRRY